MARLVGTPAEQIEGMRRAPFWPDMEAVAPTLAHDQAAIMGEPWSVPAELAARVPVLSQAIPQGQLRMLAGQTHEVEPGVLAPVLVEFLTS